MPDYMTQNYTDMAQVSRVEGAQGDTISMQYACPSLCKAYRHPKINVHINGQHMLFNHILSFCIYFFGSHSNLGTFPSVGV